MFQDPDEEGAREFFPEPCVSEAFAPVEGEEEEDPWAEETCFISAFSGPSEVVGTSGEPLADSSSSVAPSVSTAVSVSAADPGPPHLSDKSQPEPVSEPPSNSSLDSLAGQAECAPGNNEPVVAEASPRNPEFQVPSDRW
eukprot:7369618-Pyramimonas_sp.AAC.1